MGAFDRTEKTWKDIDWDAVNFKSSRQDPKDPNAGHWSWGRGGYPHNDWEYSISYVDDKLNETRYKMPEAISHMLRVASNCGKELAQREIKHIIGCGKGCPMKAEELHVPEPEKGKLDSVIETFKCLISCCEKMPGMKLEDAFNSEAFANMKEEYRWLLEQKEEGE